MNGVFPGQYFDSETGLHYNYYRDYDPRTGRYVQSDPVGLVAGVNTYAYVFGNPLRNADQLGLDVTVGYYPSRPLDGNLATHLGIAVNSVNTMGMCPQDAGLELLSCPDVEGAIKSDSTARSAASIKGAQYITIKTSLAQDQLIREFLSRAMTGGNATYNLCSNNCSRFVMDALAAGGVILTDYDSVTPGGVMGQLRKQYPGAVSAQ